MRECYELLHTYTSLSVPCIAGFYVVLCYVCIDVMRFPGKVSQAYVMDMTELQRGVYICMYTGTHKAP